MRSLGRFVVAGLLVGLAIAFSCGGSGTEGNLTPTGGELCLGDRKICINVPPKGLTDNVILRLSSGSDTPEAALSDAFDIAATNGKPVKFALPATVTIKLDIVDANDVPSETLLRIYTRDPETNEWVALDSPSIDHLRAEVTGKTTHLSPFVVLRADRLPDGGLPVEIAGSVRDGGVIVLPPIPDAGRGDAGKPDGGGAHTDAGPASDSGVVDSGLPPVIDAGGPVDSGQPVVDAGQPVVDAGTPDAGTLDAGQPPVDAGEPDAGEFDAGSGLDAGCDSGPC